MIFDNSLAKGVMLMGKSQRNISAGGEAKRALVPGQNDHRRRGEPSGSPVEAEASTLQSGL